MKNWLPDRISAHWRKIKIIAICGTILCALGPFVAAAVWTTYRQANAYHCPKCGCSWATHKDLYTEDGETTNIEGRGKHVGNFRCCVENSHVVVMWDDGDMVYYGRGRNPELPKNLGRWQQKD